MARPTLSRPQLSDFDMFRPGLFAVSQSHSQYSITDRATTVPSADVTDDQGIIAGYNDRGIRVTPLRKIPAYFRRPPRIFPQKIRPTRAQSGNKAMKMRLSWWEVVGTGIASTCRRGEVESPFSSFSFYGTVSLGRAVASRINLALSQPGSGLTLSH